jgi:5-methylcytosine-specific restriction endonuclease McrA
LNQFDYQTQIKYNIQAMNTLHQPIVLVLNRNWQPINIRTPKEAFEMLCAGASTAMDIDGPDNMRPVSWDEWITLPVREQDKFVQTAKSKVRIPVVIIAVNYARVPKRRPKLCPASVRQRDGNRCQYTGKILRPEEGSLDHVLPRSRGGRSDWTNLVWSDKAINAKKANRTPAESGLRLLRQPRKPLEMPASAMIKNNLGVPEWEYFIKA